MVGWGGPYFPSYYISCGYDIACYILVGRFVKWTDNEQLQMMGSGAMNLIWGACIYRVSIWFGYCVLSEDAGGMSLLYQRRPWKLSMLLLLSGQPQLGPIGHLTLVPVPHVSVLSECHTQAQIT